MPFASVSSVETAGGIDDAGAYLLFRYADKPTLDGVIAQYVTFASSWVKTRAGASVYAAAALDADLTNLFTLGETYICLHFVFPILQARRVMGSHYPLEEEDSSRFEALIDVQWMKLAEDLLEPYLTVELENKPFAMPVFLLGPLIDTTDDNPAIDTEEVILEGMLDRVRSLSIGATPSP